MSKHFLNKKDTIKKKIELRHQNLVFIDKRKVMNERDRLRTTFKNVNKPINLPLSSTKYVNDNDIFIPIKTAKPNFVNYGNYVKDVDVDFDAVFCVSSYERYDKIERILTQIFSQKTKYRFKFILMNDGSLDKRYIDLKNKFPDIVYLENVISGGKINYWKTINILWNKAKEFKTYSIIQIDDDFILCNNFLNILLDKFFEIKENCNDYMIFSFHLYNFIKDKPLESFWYNENEIFVDGGMLFDIQFMKKINYELDGISQRVTSHTSTFTWVRIKERLLEFGMKVYRFENSLVWHDGNNDSKLHGKVRKIKRVYTKNYIDGNLEDYGQ